ncbi:MAG: tetratricopeptide repeat protein [Candidatus Hodarchaeota archaeon]
MSLPQIQTLFGQGRFHEALQLVDTLDAEQLFRGLCYKALILCLQGDIRDASPLIDQLWEQSRTAENKSHQFMVLALQTCLRSFQGREQDVHCFFQKGQTLLSSLSASERAQLKEWEGWLYYGMGISNWESPVFAHLHAALEIFEALPERRGIEWILSVIIFHSLNTNQLAIALERLNQFKATTSADSHLFGRAFALFLEGGLLWFQGDLEQGLALYHQALPLLDQHGLHWLIGMVFNGLAWMYYLQGDFVQALSYAEQAIHLMESKGFYFPQPWNALFNIYRAKGAYSEALRVTQQRLAFCEANHNHPGILQSTRLIASLYADQGDFTAALKWARQSLTHSEVVNDKWGQASSFSLLGHFYSQLGRFEQAIHSFHQALAVDKELPPKNRTHFGQFHFSSGIQAALAELYSLKGDFDQALEFMQTALTQVKADDAYFSDTALYYLGLGKILFKKGDYLQAQTQFQNSLAFSERHGNPLFLATALYYLVLTCSELDARDEAQDYLHQLEQIRTDTAQRLINHQWQIAKGVLFKKSPRASMKVKAQEIFQLIMAEELVDLDLTVFAMLNLVDILVWELSSTGHEEVLQEIQHVLTRLQEIAQHQQSVTLELEVALIQSQVDLIQGNINRAMTLLNHTKTIALEHHLDHHQVRIENQRQAIETELTKWKELTEQNAPLITRIQQSQLQDYITAAVQFVEKGTSQEEKKRQHLTSE